MRIRYWLRDLRELAVILVIGILAGLLASAVTSPSRTAPHPVSCRQYRSPAASCFRG